MGAYICNICDNMFCSHDVNYYYCEKCETAFCEDCWSDRLHEDQESADAICGECYEDLKIKAEELTEKQFRA